MIPSFFHLSFFPFSINMTSLECLMSIELIWIIFCTKNWTLVGSSSLCILAWDYVQNFRWFNLCGTVDLQQTRAFEDVKTAWDGSLVYLRSVVWEGCRMGWVLCGHQLRIHPLAWNKSCVRAWQNLGKLEVFNQNICFLIWLCIFFHLFLFFLWQH